jgi:hypothetical protein
MGRALELLNKTNQFNTTGARYTLVQCHQHFMAGGRLCVLQAEDRFTPYGLIGAAWVQQNCIQHLVMSCRALGMGIEDAFLAGIAHLLAGQGATLVLGQLQPTEANIPCRQLYRRNGFIQAPDNSLVWSRPLAQPLVAPPHISLTLPEDKGVPGAGTGARGEELSLDGPTRPHPNGSSLQPLGQGDFEREELCAAP